MLNRWLTVIALLLPAHGALAQELVVAVANNFYRPMQALAEDFYRLSQEKVLLSTGSTGQLYAQIRNGAPFDIFLAADPERPKRLSEEGLATERFTYARGRLVLWATDPARINNGGQSLKDNDIRYIALAEPLLAPYGQAAVETLTRLKLLPQLQSKLVQGKGVTSVYQYVVSGNAQLGFVALSQVYQQGESKQGAYWEVPAEYYTPIRQDAALLTRAQDNPTALAFMHYLRSERAKAVIASYGYH
jgi:molybdate transport system substrate-binding protein